MSNLKFADTYNMVAFLEKPAESDGFEEIVDFLNAQPIRYALTINPTIYTSCINQFWATTKVKTINREVQLQALMDGKKITIIESTIRSDLQLEDAEGVDYEAVYKEWEDNFVRAATTASSLEAKHDSGNIIKTRSKATPNEAGSQGTTLGGGHMCQQTMGDTIAQTRVLALEETKTTQAAEITSLKKRVKKIEKGKKSRTHKLKRLYKTLNDEDLFGVNDLDGDEVIGMQEPIESAPTISLQHDPKDKDLFVPMDSKVVKGSKDKEEGSNKRTLADLEQEVTKKQKVDDDQETAELK
ncbi:hypothetical protein Tco_0892425 [Tanacetum coccineum]|uniref:Xylulose kinase-1 n=1 Tax=Tanacetum coccineum TaxID=301880 RepID=A0ABQ5C8Y3_9ASTR